GAVLCVAAAAAAFSAAHREVFAPDRPCECRSDYGSLILVLPVVPWNICEMRQERRQNGLRVFKQNFTVLCRPGQYLWREPGGIQTAAQTSRMERSWLARRPKRGAKLPLSAAVPIVMRSAPAAATSRTRRGESMLPATM